MTILAGIDPGQHTGVVVLEANGPQLSTGRWLAHATLHVSDRKGLTHAERDADLCKRVELLFRGPTPKEGGRVHYSLTPRSHTWEDPEGVALVVLEEPLTAMSKWRGYTRQQRGTAFRLGAYYGAAVNGARRGAAAARLVSYPPTPSPGRPGWMQGKSGAVVLSNAVALARALRAPVTVFETKDDKGCRVYRYHDVLMALGVLAYHWGASADPLTPAVGV